MTASPVFTLIAEAGTEPGAAFVGKLSDGTVRVGFRAVGAITFPAGHRFAAAYDLAAMAASMSAGDLTDAVAAVMA